MQSLDVGDAERDRAAARSRDGRRVAFGDDVPPRDQPRRVRHAGQRAHSPCTARRAAAGRSSRARAARRRARPGTRLVEARPTTALRRGRRARSGDGIDGVRRVEISPARIAPRGGRRRGAGGRSRVSAWGPGPDGRRHADGLKQTRPRCGTHDFTPRAEEATRAPASAAGRCRTVCRDRRGAEIARARGGPVPERRDPPG